MSSCAFQQTVVHYSLSCWTIVSVTSMECRCDAHFVWEDIASAISGARSHLQRDDCVTPPGVLRFARGRSGRASNPCGPNDGSRARSLTSALLLYFGVRRPTQRPMAFINRVSRQPHASLCRHGFEEAPARSLHPVEQVLLILIVEWGHYAWLGQCYCLLHLVFVCGRIVELRCSERSIAVGRALLVGVRATNSSMLPPAGHK